MERWRWSIFGPRGVGPKAHIDWKISVDPDKVVVSLTKKSITYQICLRNCTQRKPMMALTATFHSCQYLIILVKLGRFSLQSFWSGVIEIPHSWWRHQMSPSVTGEFPSQRPVTRGFDVFFDLPLNKRPSKQSRSRWIEAPWRSLWRHCNVYGFSTTCVIGCFIWLYGPVKCLIFVSARILNHLFYISLGIALWWERVTIMYMKYDSTKYLA